MSDKPKPKNKTGPPADKRHVGGRKGVPKPPVLLVGFHQTFKSNGTKGPEVLRTLFARDPQEFLVQYQRAVTAYSAEKRAARAVNKSLPADGGPPPDAGTDRCLELVDRLLAESSGPAGGPPPTPPGGG